MRHTVLALLAACGSASNPSSPAVSGDEVATPTEQAAAPSFPATCKLIADDIERIARQYPQLIEFSAADQRECAISYGFNTHRSKSRGGWTAGVPNPDPDGIWFYIGIYDPNGPDAQAQIHTQPAGPDRWLGSRKVMFLILEGEKTLRARGAISKILEKHGMQTR